jgi:acyl dehydratase
MSKAAELIAKYRALIDQETHLGEWLLIDQARIDSFAQVTGDVQWIHTDPERAERESPFGTTIAHGFLTLSLLPFLTRGNDPETFAESYPGMSLRINYGLNKVRFPTPVRCGDRLRARTVVSAADAVEDGVQLIFTILVEIEGRDKPACVAEQIFRLYP